MTDAQFAALRNNLASYGDGSTFSFDTFVMTGYTIEEADGTDAIWNVSIRRDYRTVEEAQAVAASFPKSWGVKATRCSGSIDKDFRVNVQWGVVGFSAYFKPDGTTGAANEAGLKRLRRFVAALKGGYEIRVVSGNGASAERIERLIATGER